MDKTYEPIAAQTLGSAAASVTFGSIPQTYTDLVLIASTQTSNNVDVFMRFNSDTANNYSLTNMVGNGTSASSNRLTSRSDIIIMSGNPSTSISTYIVNIFNYTNATTFKTSLIRSNLNDRVAAIVGLWRATPAAITTINIRVDTGNFNTGSSFTLYGIKAA